MERFLTWFENPGRTNPVLVAGIAHLWFVTVHPFEDGNGRIGRAIADLALARSDGMKGRFYSLSTEIEARRSAYYDRLEAAQRADVDVTEWLAWFLECVGSAVDRAQAILRTVFARGRVWRRVNEHPLDERQRKVVARLMEDFRGGLTSSKYAAIAKCSPDTALRDIRRLIEWGVLVQNPGGGRSTSYRLADFDDDSG